MPHLMLLLGPLAGSTSSSVVATFTLFAMIGEVNRKRNDSARLFLGLCLPALRSATQVRAPISVNPMFDAHKRFRRRLHIARKSGGLSVRIERQNARAGYFWTMCLSTVMLGFFCNMLWGSSIRHPHDVLYATLPMFVLGLTCYVLALAVGISGAFGVEEVSTQAGSLRWTRTALKWTRTSDIPMTEITEIRAITHWHGDYTVEVSTARKQRRIGDRLLRDEASELAKHLRHAVGLTR